MFNLFSKSKSKEPAVDFSRIGADMHSHLLPGIDDGVPDIETSLELIKGLQALGFKKIITTPHIMWDMYRNTPRIIQEKLSLVRTALQENNIDVEINAAGEYFLDEHVEDLLEKREPLLTISDNKVLVEFSMAFPSLNIKDILFEMQMQGYQPIIAHPERYTYLQQDKKFYDELRDIGCIFQLNILSLSGHYGRSVLELANYLMKNNFYELIGTDMHHIGHLEALKELRMNTGIRTLLDSGRLINTQL